MAEETLKVSLKSRNEQHICKTFKENYDSKDCREYRIDYPSRGRAVIANFAFKGEEVERRGCEKDVSCLTDTLGKCLKFDVDVWKLDGVDAKAFMERVKEESKKPEHEDGDCFVMVLMTHGHTGGVLSAHNGTSFKLEKVVEYFTGDNCRALRGKPKIFVVQACRGSQGQPGVYVSKSAQNSKPTAEMITIPVSADIIIAQAQLEGYYSLRHPEDGSYFIRSLCYILEFDHKKDDDKKDDFVRLITFATNMVANFEFTEKKESKQSGIADTDKAMADAKMEEEEGVVPSREVGEKGELGVDAKPFQPQVPPAKPTYVESRLVKQMPCMASNLRKLLFFRSKDVEKKA